MVTRKYFSKSNTNDISTFIGSTVTFLDTKVFHIAKAIPVQEKVETGCTKKILRDAFKGYLPDEVLYRKKLGFPTTKSLAAKRTVFLGRKINFGK